MIVWLASYPKSGNTLLRSMLTAYLFSNDGNYSFGLLKNIKQFPNKKTLDFLGINVIDRNEIVKNSIRGQEIFNKNSGVGFLKTHNSLYNFKGKYPFTDYKNTLGAIYIVRDPRNVIISYSRHLDMSIEKTANFLMKGNTSYLDIMGTWRENYLSWKNMIRDKKCLLVRYEDLVSQRKTIFLQILKFVYQLRGIKFTVNKDKLENMLETTSFDYLKNLEKENDFEESVKNKEGNKTIFFDEGPNRKWSNVLNRDILNQVESVFKQEMIELGYISS